MANFENVDSIGDQNIVMLKCGDDLRMDIKMSLYKVLCTGNQQGILEMVSNAETLANIHVKGGGTINQFFSKNSIKNG